MLIATGGLTAECDCMFEQQVRERMLCILENIEDRIFPHSHVVIVDKVDGVFYEIINGKEVKEDIPL